MSVRARIQHIRGILEKLEREAITPIDVILRAIESNGLEVVKPKNGNWVIADYSRKIKGTGGTLEEAYADLNARVITTGTPHPGSTAPRGTT